MSLPEIIPSNLPQFVQNKNRSSFANSIIPSGSVLLFAESDGNGGSKLIAKNPDGSFSEVGGGSMKFYKCASVGSGTWTGYLASVDPVTGVWSFASTATSGLTYDRITPVVGNVYDEGCTFLVTKYNNGLPEDGLVFYLPLTSSSATDELGRSIAVSNLSFVDGFASFNGTSSKISVSNLTGIPSGSDERTVSLFVRINQTVDHGHIFNHGSQYNRFLIHQENQSGGGGLRCWSAANDQEEFFISNPEVNTWYHLCVVQNTTQTLLYLNSTQVGILSCTIDNGNSNFYIGCNDVGNGSFFNGDMKAFRIYNRALSAAEISALASEFTPTAS